MSKNDVVNNPSHYTDGGIETLDFIESKLGKEKFIGFCIGNVIKYVSRAGKKENNPLIQDYKKAQFYLNRAIKSLETKDENK